MQKSTSPTDGSAWLPSPPTQSLLHSERKTSSESAGQQMTDPNTEDPEETSRSSYPSKNCQSHRHRIRFSSLTKHSKSRIILTISIKLFRTAPWQRDRIQFSSEEDPSVFSENFIRRSDRWFCMLLTSQVTKSIIDNSLMHFNLHINMVRCGCTWRT